MCMSPVAPLNEQLALPCPTVAVLVPTFAGGLEAIAQRSPIGLVVSGRMCPVRLVSSLRCCVTQLDIFSQRSTPFRRNLTLRTVAKLLRVVLLGVKPYSTQ